MGQGVIADVSRRLASQAAVCIEARLAARDDADATDLPTAGPLGGISLMASVLGSRVRGLASSLEGRSGDNSEERESDPVKGADDGPR